MARHRARARQKVVDLCKKNNLKFLNAGRASDTSVDSVIKQIKDGAMVIESDEEAAVKGANTPNAKCLSKPRQAFSRRPLVRC